jgi:hypothetical protein
MLFFIADISEVIGKQNAAIRSVIGEFVHVTGSVKGIIHGCMH